MNFPDRTKFGKRNPDCPFKHIIQSSEPIIDSFGSNGEYYCPSLKELSQFKKILGKNNEYVEYVYNQSRHPNSTAFGMKYTYSIEK